MVWLAFQSMQLNQIQKTVGWEEAMDRTREHFNRLCIPKGRQLSLLFSTGDYISGSVTGLVTHSYHDSFWWEMGREGAKSVEAIPSCSHQKGCDIMWDSRLSRYYLIALSGNPQCDYPVQSKGLRWKEALAEERKGLLKGPGLSETSH